MYINNKFFSFFSSFTVIILTIMSYSIDFTTSAPSPLSSSTSQSKSSICTDECYALYQKQCRHASATRAEYILCGIQFALCLKEKKACHRRLRLFKRLVKKVNKFGKTVQMVSSKSW